MARQDGDESDAVRVFRCTGHGACVADESGDGRTGGNCLVPYDFQTAGMFIDDIPKTLYGQFPRTGNLTLVMDSCHSGSVQKGLDVIYRSVPVSAEEQERIGAAAARFAQDQREYVVNQSSNYVFRNCPRRSCGRKCAVVDLGL